MKLREICDIAAMNGLKDYPHTMDITREGKDIRIGFIDRKMLGGNHGSQLTPPKPGDEYARYLYHTDLELAQMERLTSGGISMMTEVFFECADESTAKHFESLLRGEITQEPAQNSDMDAPSIEGKPVIHRTHAITRKKADNFDLLGLKIIQNKETGFADTLSLRYSADRNTGNISYETIQYQSAALAAEAYATLYKTVSRNRALRSTCSGDTPSFLMRSL